MIQIHRLEGLFWVVRSGGYAKAARAMPYPITQPALHQQVKKLEGELGLQLLERVGKSEMKATPAGRKLYEFCAPFFEGLAPLLRELGDGEFGGDLHVDAQGLFIRRLLPAWLGRLRRARANVRVHLREMKAPLLDRLRNGKADLVVSWLPELPDDVAAQRIATVRTFVVTPAGHAALRKRRVDWAALDDETFVGFGPEHFAFEPQREALRELGLAPQHVISVDATETILGYVEAGLGYSLVPSLEEDGPRGRRLRARPLEVSHSEFPVYAAWRRDAGENPLLDTAIETAPSE